ncbi:phosphodiesterase [Streptomyces sp. NPDC029674]|uniref:phosphodiesterase n=1 Tax=Streptomyces sp. NPDC029674 TaxID=3365297 RepID=UPI0038505D6C
MGHETTTASGAGLPAGVRLAARAARSLARRRRAPALHPYGVTCDGALAVRPAGVPWGEPWLDEPGEYRVRLRWSRAVGLPGKAPDALGLALRVYDAGGPDRPLELLLTSSGSGRHTRHLPVPRLNALAGPYSTLLSYRVGDREAVLAVRPAAASPRVPGGVDSLRTVLRTTSLTFHLCAAPQGQAWQPLATLTTGAVHDVPPVGTGAYDPYVNRLARLHPTARFGALREAAYAASRRGRHAPDPADPADPADP